MNLLREEAEKLGISLDEKKLNQFKIYMEYMLEYNEHTNLTSIKNEEDVAIKHFLDSIFVLKFLKVKENAKIIDIGSGAGFPGVPLKIVLTNSEFLLVDSLNKRVTFLKNLISKLGLEKIDALHARAEELGNQPKFREKFDFAVSRAVAPLNVLCEYCLSFLNLGGCFVVMKGPEVSEEIKAASNAISVLGGVLEAQFSFELPLEKGKRSILVIRKANPTPKKYPRKNSKISSCPL